MHFFVIGDVMLDIDYQGKHRGNEDGAELCLTSDRRKIYPGGAAWVAWLLAGAGHEVDLFGVVGADTEAEDLAFSLPSVNRHFKPLLVSTTVKRRVHTERGVYRFDTENPKAISWPVLEATRLLEHTHLPDCVLFVDYNKGVFWETEDSAEIWFAIAGIPERSETVAAIKPTEYLNLWNDMDLVVCNRGEANNAELTYEWTPQCPIVVTDGSMGAQLYERDGSLGAIVECPEQVASPQVIGAGDAFLAALVSHWFLLGVHRCPPEEAVEYAILRATKYVSIPREELCSRYFV